MPNGIELGQLANNVGVVTGCLILVGMFARDTIVSGRRLRRVEAERDRWVEIALEALGAARKTVAAAEVVHKLVTSLPDPGADSGDREGRTESDKQ